MYKCLTFSFGRDALRYLIHKYDIKELNIPYYLCDVIRHTLAEENCKPLFYHIDDNFYPAREFMQEDYILYPNYWGICAENVSKLVKKYPKLIVDNAHAYYNKPQGFACFNAGHKFGFEDSLLWIKSNNNVDAINIQESDKEIRRKIFFELHEKYKKTNLLKIDNMLNPDTYTFPYVYPYLAETTDAADKLVNLLKKEGKTVYRYWNPLPKSFCEYKFYSRLVPIPILPYRAD